MADDWFTLKIQSGDDDPLYTLGELQEAVDVLAAHESRIPIRERLAEAAILLFVIRRHMPRWAPATRLIAPPEKSASKVTSRLKASRK
jgi:hypothetical protein